MSEKKSLGHNSKKDFLKNPVEHIDITSFDARNIISVYRATGNPDDDGYLTAEASQNDILSKNNPVLLVSAVTPV